MAAVHDHSQQIEIVLRPFRLLEDGAPTWLSTHLKVKQNQATLLETTISLTREDLDALRDGLSAIAEDVSPAFRIVTSDDDFIFEVQRLDAPERSCLGFWVGEPFQLMTGFRIVVFTSELPGFASELLADEAFALQKAPSST